MTEVELTEAVVRIAWTYEELPTTGRALTQHMVLQGPGAEAYVPVMDANFAPNLGKGLEKLAASLPDPRLNAPALLDLVSPTSSG